MIVRDKVNFLDLEFDRSTMSDMVGWMRARVADDSFAYIVTPNVDHVVQIDRRPSELRPLYHNATYCLCDSRVLAKLASLVGVHLTVVPGSDLIVSLFDAVLNAGDRICFVGGDSRTMERLRELYPTVSIIQHVAPMGLRSDSNGRAIAVAAAVEAHARFTLFAVGCPQQEMLAFEMAQISGATGTGLCIGAAMDFIVGAQKRAPRIFQQAGLEWLWRLARNPRRLARRYLWDGPRVLLTCWRWRSLGR